MLIGTYVLRRLVSGAHSSFPDRVPITAQAQDTACSQPLWNVLQDPLRACGSVSAPRVAHLLAPRLGERARSTCLAKTRTGCSGPGCTRTATSATSRHLAVAQAQKECLSCNPRTSSRILQEILPHRASQSTSLRGCVRSLMTQPQRARFHPHTFPTGTAGARSSERILAAVVSWRLRQGGRRPRRLCCWRRSLWRRTPSMSLTELLILASGVAMCGLCHRTTERRQLAICAANTILGCRCEGLPTLRCPQGRLRVPCAEDWCYEGGGLTHARRMLSWLWLPKASVVVTSHRWNPFPRDGRCGDANSTCPCLVVAPAEDATVSISSISSARGPCRLPPTT